MTTLAQTNRTPTPAKRTAYEWNPVRLVENMLGWDPFTSLMPAVDAMAKGVFVPTIDVIETKDGYRFTADLPGIPEENLDISFTGNQLVISGKREAAELPEVERYHLYERAHGQFTRSFTLPDGADPTQVTANLKDGVLTLMVGKRPEVQPRRIPLSQKPQGSA